MLSLNDNDAHSLTAFSRVVSGKHGVISCTVLTTVVFIFDVMIIQSLYARSVSTQYENVMTTETEFWHQFLFLLMCYGASFLSFLFLLNQCLKSSLTPRYLWYGFYAFSFVRLVLHYCFELTASHRVGWMLDSLLSSLMLTSLFVGSNWMLISSYPETSLWITGSGFGLHFILHILFIYTTMGTQTSPSSNKPGQFAEVQIFLMIYGLVFFLIRSNHLHHLSLFEHSHYYTYIRELSQKRQQLWVHTEQRVNQHVNWRECMKKVFHCFAVLAPSRIDLELNTSPAIEDILLSNGTLIEEISSSILKSMIFDRNQFCQCKIDVLVTSSQNRSRRSNCNSFLVFDFQYQTNSQVDTDPQQQRILQHFWRPITSSTVQGDTKQSEVHSDIRIEKYQEWIDLHGGYTFSDVFISQSSPGRESVGTSENVEDEQTTPSANVGTVVCSVGFALPYILPSQQSVSVEDTKDFSFPPYDSSSPQLRRRLQRSIHSLNPLINSNVNLMEGKTQWQLIIISKNSFLMKLLKITLSRYAIKLENNKVDTNVRVFESSADFFHDPRFFGVPNEDPKRICIFITNDVKLNTEERKQFQQFRLHYHGIKFVHVGGTENKISDFDICWRLPFESIQLTQLFHEFLIDEDSINMN